MDSNTVIFSQLCIILIMGMRIDFKTDPEINVPNEVVEETNIKLGG